jgi:hypothetical protein
MALAKLSAGASLDILSGEEHKRHLSAFQRDIERTLSERDGTTEVRSGAPFLTDGSGNTSSLPDGGGQVYRVPTGFDAFLLRLSLDYETSNPGSPVTCGVRICADAVTPAALRGLTNALPNVYSASRSHAPLFRGGQRIIVGIQGGPATTLIYPTVQVLLVPNRHHVRHDTLEASGA